MEQLCIFEQPKDAKSSLWKVYIDGASRNNPGPSGAGVVITKDGELVDEHGFSLGHRTNNQAEYLALLLGIFLVKDLMPHDDRLTIISDSELLVRQLKGHYKVKDEMLQKLFSIAKHLLSGISCQVQHVLRDQNKEADRMANKGIESKHAVPKAFIQMLEKHHMAWQ